MRAHARSNVHAVGSLADEALFFLIVADSTYSDATGAGCWGRLLVQNMGWDLSATISWYLIGSFARGMDYDSDGILRAEWPNSGHFELTP